MKPTKPMADEVGRRLESSDARAEVLARFSQPATRVVGWAAGGVFRAVQAVVPLDLAYLIDSDPAKQGTRAKGIEVQPVEALEEEDPENTIIIFYTAGQRALREQLEALGPFRSLSAQDVLAMAALPPHRVVDHETWSSVSPAERAHRAIDRAFLWSVLRIPRRARFAIAGRGEFTGPLIDLCRRHGREPAVVIDEGSPVDALDGVPVRDAARGYSEFRPDFVLDGSLDPTVGRRPDASDARRADCAWRDWRTACQSLDATRYHEAEDGRRWARAHVALWERLSTATSTTTSTERLPSGALCGHVDTDGFDGEPGGFTGLRLAPADLASAIEHFRDKPLKSQGISLESLEGERVALVGPAASLVGAGRGEEIDAHDRVVRLNTTIEHLPFTPEDAVDFGSRCDSLYVSFAYLDKLFEHRREDVDRAVEQAGLREIVCIDSLLKVDAFGGAYAARVAAIREDLAARHPELRFHFESELVRTLVFWLAGHAPRMGFGAIVDLLTRRPAALSAMGFTFYHGGGHLFRGLQPATLDPTTSNSGKASLHDSRLELRVLDRLIESERFEIELDETLMNLLATSPATRSGAGADRA